MDNKHDAIVLGCDPGQYGALVAIMPEGGIEFESTPLEISTLTKHPTVNAIKVAEFVDRLSHKDIVFVVENVHSHPGQGVASTFKFGYTTGIVTGSVIARATGNGVLLSYHKVTPQAWKKEFGLLRQPKDAAIQLMQQHLPDVDFSGISKQKLSGIADAYFIAKYGIHNLV